MILVSQELEPLYKKFRDRFPKLTASKPYGSFMAARTFLLMGFIRSLDCYRDVPTTFKMWGSIFTEWNFGELFSEKLAATGFDLTNIAIIGVATAIVCAVNAYLVRSGSDARVSLEKRPWLNYSLFALLMIAVLLFGAYGVGYDASAFIYEIF